MKRTVVLITGSSSGFGRDTALTLARAGLQVYGTMRDVDGRNRSKAGSLMVEARAEALPLSVVGLDVTSDSSVAHAVERVAAAAGRIDVLVNNAGVASAGVSEAFTEAQLSALFDVNVVGVHRVSRAVLPVMRRQRSGLVINVGSILGRVTLPFFGVYGASKFALEALTETYRYEVSQFGVEFVLLQPSAYPTPMYEKAMVPEEAQRIKEYGDIAQIPGAMFEHFKEVFSSDYGPRPHDVAEAILGLIALPAGKRPARVVVGADFGAASVNEHAAPIQSKVLNALGLNHLNQVTNVG